MNHLEIIYRTEVALPSEPRFEKFFAPFFQKRSAGYLAFLQVAFSGFHPNRVATNDIARRIEVNSGDGGGPVREFQGMATDIIEPRGELSLRTVAMPADTNPSGDIFGGWIMSLMDLAAGVAAGSLAKGRVATAAVSNLSFIEPVKVGDVVCVYTDIVRIGRTSVTLAVEAWVLRHGQGIRVRVTAAEFVLVAVDANGRPRPFPRTEA